MYLYLYLSTYILTFIGAQSRVFALLDALLKVRFYISVYIHIHNIYMYMYVYTYM